MGLDAAGRGGRVAAGGGGGAATTVGSSQEGINGFVAGVGLGADGIEGAGGGGV